MPSAEAARRFGYTPGSFRVLCHEFRKNPSRTFFVSPTKAGRISPPRQRVREKIVTLRKQNFSVYDIRGALDEAAEANHRFELAPEGQSTLMVQNLAVIEWPDPAQVVAPTLPRVGVAKGSGLVAPCSWPASFLPRAYGSRAKAPRRKGEDMTENEIAANIVDAAYKVHTTLGPGLLESVYEAVLTYELAKRGLGVQRQVPIPVTYEGIRFDVGFKADLLMEQPCHRRAQVCRAEPACP